ncbi:MAG TPA: TIGR04551 family protein, partial [Anaeromyxobacteraceae bacterium]|nr:TIGR04551 family protein [Anaeromyxobacteraceae bacterium]
KLQFLELDGYLRVRGDMLDNMALKRGLDANGEYLVPRPLFNTTARGTQNTANMRLRLIPTLNVSEHVRARAEVDVLDDYVLGTSAGATWQAAAPADRPAIQVKRAWAEVETPVGLLSVGRMPSAFGLGLVASDANGLDDDLGDTHDRIQFATLPLSTPLGQLSLVPFLDFDAEGTLQTDIHTGAGTGQPFDRDNADDARTWGLKLLRLDTDAELRRKLERGETSLNYGAMYLYSTVGKVKNPYWVDPTSTTQPVNNLRDEYYDRTEYRHQLSLWFRMRSARTSVEAELSGVAGQIGDPGPYSATLDWTGRQLLMRQLGGAVRAGWQAMPNKLRVGGELGFASGDPAPGFGNRPGTIAAGADPLSGGPVTFYGGVEGPQYDPARGDRVIRNFQFNPGYRIDMILWREILGAVTDAWYLKPTLRWDVFPGLGVDAQLVYSQAMYGSSTPSATALGKGNKPLGLEFDAKVDYQTDDGFAAWLGYGVLFPLSGFDGAGSLTRAHAIRAGVAVKF